MNIDSQTKAIAQFIGLVVIFAVYAIGLAIGIICFLTLNW
jgi:hypothetical protein